MTGRAQVAPDGQECRRAEPITVLDVVDLVDRMPQGAARADVAALADTLVRRLLRDRL